MVVLEHALSRSGAAECSACDVGFALCAHATSLVGRVDVCGCGYAGCHDDAGMGPEQHGRRPSLRLEDALRGHGIRWDLVVPGPRCLGRIDLLDGDRNHPGGRQRRAEVPRGRAVLLYADPDARCPWSDRPGHDQHGHDGLCRCDRGDQLRGRHSDRTPDGAAAGSALDGDLRRRHADRRWCWRLRRRAVRQHLQRHRD